MHPSSSPPNGPELKPVQLDEFNKHVEEGKPDYYG